MTKEIFLKKLEQALSVSLGHVSVRENISYYEDYIVSEMKKGRAEEEIIASLGDPRLLAKTIIQTEKMKENNTLESETKQEEETNGYGSVFSTRIKHLPVGIWLFLICLIALLFIGSVIAVVYRFLPIIIIVALIWNLVSYYKRR